MTRAERDRETALALSEASQAAIKLENAAPRRICTVGSMNGNPVDERNARLIAAAPELLEAAIELKDACNRPAAARTRAEAWRKLDAAIAKATGGTQ